MVSINDGYEPPEESKKKDANSGLPLGKYERVPRLTTKELYYGPAKPNFVDALKSNQAQADAAFAEREAARKKEGAPTHPDFEKIRAKNLAAREEERKKTRQSS